jgi:hypothetical protein
MQKSKKSLFVHGKTFRSFNGQRRFKESKEATLTLEEISVSKSKMEELSKLTVSQILRTGLENHQNFFSTQFRFQ